MEPLEGRRREGHTTLKYRTKKSWRSWLRAEAEPDAALDYRSDRWTHMQSHNKSQQFSGCGVSPAGTCMPKPPV